MTHVRAGEGFIAGSEVEHSVETYVNDGAANPTGELHQTVQRSDVL